MRIGIIGSGNIGQTLAERLVGAGHEVVLANSRGPETLAPLVRRLGDRASAATADEAAAAGDLVIVSVPFGRHEQVPAAPLASKATTTPRATGAGPRWTPMRPPRASCSPSTLTGRARAAARGVGGPRIAAPVRKAAQLLRAERGVVDVGVGLLAAALRQRSQVHGVEADLVDQLADRGLGVGVLARDRRARLPAAATRTAR